MPEIYRAKVRPYRGVGAASMQWPSYMVGREFGAKAGIGQGLMQIGRTIGQIDAMLYDIEGNSQFDTARREATERINALSLSLEENDQPNTYQDHYKRVLSDIKTIAPTNKVGARKFQSWLDVQTPHWDMGVTQEGRRRIVKNRDSAFALNIQSLKEGNMSAEALTELKTITAGYIDDRGDKIYADKQFRDVVSHWQYRQAWSEVADMPYGEAVERIAKMEGITETQRSGLRVRRGNLERAREMQLAQQQETERAEVYDDIANGTATRESIEAMKSLPEAEQQSLWELAEKAARPDSTILEQTDPKIELDVQRRIDLGLPITPTEIYSYVGKGKKGGLSIDRARFYIDRLNTKRKDPEGPLNNPAVKRAQKMLDELKTDHFWLSEEAKEAGEYTPEEEKENIFTWLTLSNEFTQWVLKNPDATDEQIEEKIERMTAPKREEIKLNWFERMMWSKGRRQLFGLVLSEEERLAEKKIDSLKEEGVWDDLNMQEQIDARDAFLGGRTVQEVLDALRE